MTEEILAIGDCRRDGNGPRSSVFRKTVRTPGGFLGGVVGHLVDFEPRAASVAFEGFAVGCAFCHVVHYGAGVRGAPLIPDEFAGVLVSILKGGTVGLGKTNTLEPALTSIMPEAGMLPP